MGPLVTMNPSPLPGIREEATGGGGVGGMLGQAQQVLLWRPSGSRHFGAEHLHGEMMEMMEQDSNPGLGSYSMLHSQEKVPPAGARGGTWPAMGSGRLPSPTSMGFHPRGPLPDRRQEQLPCPERGRGGKSGGSECGPDPGLPRQPSAAASDTGQAQEEAGGRGGPLRACGWWGAWQSPAGLRSQKPV